MPGFPQMRPPPEEQLSDVQNGFAGGLNTTGDAFELQPDQMTHAENARLTQFGGVLKRLGTQRIMASAKNASAIQGGYCWRKGDGSREELMVCNGVLYSNGGTFAIPMTYTAVTVTSGTGLSNSNYIDFAAFRDGTREVLYIADGGAIFKYDPVAPSFQRITTGGTPSAILFVEVYNQRLFGVSGVDQTIFYSELNNGDSLGISPDGGQAVVRTFGNQNITTIKTIRDSLAIFHETGISRFVGLTQDDISIATAAQGFSSDVGTMFTRSIVVVDGQGYFMSERGAYIITEDGLIAIDMMATSSYARTPRKPDPTTAIVSALPSTDFTTLVVAHDRQHREIHWSIPDHGVYTFNYRLFSWAGPWTGAYTTAALTAYWESLNADGDPIVLFGSTDGFIRMEDVVGIFLDDVNANGTGGSAFTLTVTCHRFFTKRAESEKSLRWAYVFADLKSSLTTLISWNTAYGSGSFTLANVAPATLWGSGTWNAFFWGGTGATRYRIPLGGRGPFVDFTISDDGQSDSVFSRLELVAFDLGPRG